MADGLGHSPREGDLVSIGEAVDPDGLRTRAPRDQGGEETGCRPCADDDVRPDPDNEQCELERTQHAPPRRRQGVLSYGEVA